MIIPVANDVYICQTQKRFLNQKLTYGQLGLMCFCEVWRVPPSCDLPPVKERLLPCLDKKKGTYFHVVFCSLRPGRKTLKIFWFGQQWVLVHAHREGKLQKGQYSVWWIVSYLSAEELKNLWGRKRARREWGRRSQRSMCGRQGLNVLRTVL